MTRLFRAIAALLLLVAAPAFAQVSSGVPQPNFINLLDNGAFDIYQRTTTAVTGITTAATYHADRWAGYSGAATSMSLTNVTSSLPANFTNAEQVQRTSGQTGVLPVCLVQEIPTADVTALQGQPVVLSAWIKAGSGFSAASSLLSFQVPTGTGSDEGLAALISGWAGAATPVNITQAITSSWQRYAVTGTIGATATEAAAQFCFTPVGTAGTADNFTITGVQLSSTNTLQNYERRPYATELNKAYRYYWRLTEPAAGVLVASGAAITTGYCVFTMPLPQTMRAAPTLSFSTQTTSTWEMFDASATPITLSGATSLIQNAFGANTVNTIGLKATGAATPFTAGHGCMLAGAGGANSYLAASADF
jgi:hypothetical protein